MLSPYNSSSQQEIPSQENLDNKSYHLKSKLVLKHACKFVTALATAIIFGIGIAIFSHFIGHLPIAYVISIGLTTGGLLFVVNCIAFYCIFRWNKKANSPKESSSQKLTVDPSPLQPLVCESSSQKLTVDTPPSQPLVCGSSSNENDDKSLNFIHKNFNEKVLDEKDICNLTRQESETLLTNHYNGKRVGLFRYAARDKNQLVFSYNFSENKDTPIEHSIISFQEAMNSFKQQEEYNFRIILPSEIKNTSHPQAKKTENQICNNKTLIHNDKTARNQDAYRGIMQFNKNEDHKSFYLLCKKLNISSRHIYFDSTNLSCYVSSFHILVVWAKKNKKFSSLIGKNYKHYVDFEAYHSIGGKNTCSFQANSTYKRKDHEIEMNDAEKHNKLAINKLDFSDSISEKNPSTASELVSYMYSRANGVVVGEMHDEYLSKRFIIDNFINSESNKVDVIYLEHLIYEIFQQDLDEYCLGKTEEMSTTLEAYLDDLDEGHKVPTDKRTHYGFKALVMAAKKARIRVVCIDTEISYSYTTNPDRELMMNYQAKLIIDKEKRLPKSKQKFVALVGSAHVCRIYGVSGLAEILNCPGVLFSYDQNVPFVQYHQKIQDAHNEESEGYIDFVLSQSFLNN